MIRKQDLRLWLMRLLSAILILSLAICCSDGHTPGNTDSLEETDSDPGCPPTTRTQTKEHLIEVSETGEFAPALTCVIPGDTVVWRFAGSPYGHAIIPVTPPAPEMPPEALCRAYLPYDPTRVNEFVGPLPEAVSGLFSRAKDKQGLVAPGELGACPRYGPCVPQPGALFCAGQKTTGTEVIDAGQCYGPGTLCEPPAGTTTCEVPKQEPGDFLYANLRSTWSNPAVTGVLVVVNWRDLEPKKGQYFWDDLDRTIQTAVDHGKVYSLVIKADATRTGLPDWLFTAEPEGMGMEPLIFYDQYHRGESCTEARKNKRIAAHVLDYRFRERYLGILKAVADHLKEKNAFYRALAYIKPSGANLQSPENHLPQGCQEKESGVSTEACRCVSDKLANSGLKEAIDACSKIHGDNVVCCGLCNDRVWATTRYRRNKDDTDGALYTAQGLIEFYSEQTRAIATAFPGKSMAYALIQDGFPKIGVPPDKGGAWITEQILKRGADEHGVKFVVQHNALNNKAILEPWVTWRTTLDHPELLQAQHLTIEQYLDKVRTETPWLPEDAGIAFKDALVAQWQHDREQLLLDPLYSPLTGVDYLLQMEQAGISYRDPCLLKGENAPTHPKTLEHQKKYLGGHGVCANAWVIQAGATGQITGKQNNSGIMYSDQFVSSIENALEHTDAVFVEAYEEVIQRAMFDEKDLLSLTEALHERRRVSWNQWVAEKGWPQRELEPDFPTSHRHTFVAESDDTGSAPKVFYFVHGSKCLENPQVGRIVMRN